MQLSLDQIRLDGGTQPRADLLLEVIEDYAEQMQCGAQFPPVTVFFDGKDYWLADGFHRLMAAKRTWPDQPIDTEVLQGTQSHAQWHSFAANQVHGLRRTNEDKRRAVQAALTHPNGAKLSDAQIAVHVGVSNRFVGNIRATLNRSKSGGGSYAGPSGMHLRTGQDGRTINTANIGRNRGTASKSASPPRTTLKVHQPIRLPVPVEKMTSVTLPHNPVMGARTLIEVFDVAYLRAVVAELVTYLNSVTESA
jgi:hypothetical protein